jgi:hypothetical protein
MGEAQYLPKFIASFLAIGAPLHVVITKRKRFH